VRGVLYAHFKIILRAGNLSGTDVGRYQGRGYPVPLPSAHKEKVLQVALSTLRRVLYIFRCLDVRADVGHREAQVMLTGTMRALPEILLDCIKYHFLSAVQADELSRAYLVAGFRFLGQFYHQTQLWLGKLYITFVSFK